MNEKVSKSIVLNYGTDDELKITLEGRTEMPFWFHDLKLKAILGLLETVDYKDFAEDGLTDLLFEYGEQILEALGFALGE